jgi:hypothetical protein
MRNTDNACESKIFHQSLSLPAFALGKVCANGEELERVCGEMPVDIGFCGASEGKA